MATGRTLKILSSPGAAPSRRVRTGTATSKQSSLAFARVRVALAQQLYNEWNALVFSDSLPANLQLKWNARLVASAGQCVDDGSFDSLKQHPKQMIPCRIDLSSKLITTPSRLRDVLAHEMCHAAAWTMDLEFSRQHGPAFWKWASIFMELVDDVTITRYHDYQTNEQFHWKCVQCSNMYSRHRQTIDPKRHVCKLCGGALEFLGRISSQDSSQAVQAERAGSTAGQATATTPQRRATAFGAFVQQHFARARKELPGAPHGAVMKQLSTWWHEAKQQLPRTITTPPRTPSPPLRPAFSPLTTLQEKPLLDPGLKRTPTTTTQSTSSRAGTTRDKHPSGDYLVLTTTPKRNGVFGTAAVTGKGCVQVDDPPTNEVIDLVDSPGLSMVSLGKQQQQPGNDLPGLFDRLTLFDGSSAPGTGVGVKWGSQADVQDVEQRDQLVKESSSSCASSSAEERCSSGEECSSSGTSSSRAPGSAAASGKASGRRRTKTQSATRKQVKRNQMRKERSGTAQSCGKLTIEQNTIGSSHGGAPAVATNNNEHRLDVHHESESERLRHQADCTFADMADAVIDLTVDSPSPELHTGLQDVTNMERRMLSRGLARSLFRSKSHMADSNSHSDRIFASDGFLESNKEKAGSRVSSPGSCSASGTTGCALEPSDTNSPGTAQAVVDSACKSTTQIGSRRRGNSSRTRGTIGSTISSTKDCNVDLVASHSGEVWVRRFQHRTSPDRPNATLSDHFRKNSADQNEPISHFNNFVRHTSSTCISHGSGSSSSSGSAVVLIKPTGVSIGGTNWSTDCSNQSCSSSPTDPERSRARPDLVQHTKVVTPRVLFRSLDNSSDASGGLASSVDAGDRQYPAADVRVASTLRAHSIVLDLCRSRFDEYRA